MINVFGLPIMGAIVLGILYPYIAISLMPYGGVFLFLLMVCAGLSIEWKKLVQVTRRPLELLIGLVFLYLIFPFLQYLLARWLVTDEQFLYGLVLASLCPVAIVAPYFTRLTGGDHEYSFLLMVVSMILCPIVAPPVLTLLLAPSIILNVGPLMKYMLLLVTVPLLVSYVISRFLPRVRHFLSPRLGIINVSSLSMLIFILFGTAAGRINISYSPVTEISILMILAFIQDFGVLFISLAIFRHFINASSIVNALAISLSMKNVAIAAGVLLIFDPRASLPPALGFVAHAFLFSFIAISRDATWLKTPKQ
jgi:predicted Na+-dependent transporter